MGTRSLTFVIDDNSKVMCLYRQFDSYPSGHGRELAEMLAGSVVVNGYSSSTPKKAYNGMGCLAASIVAKLKDGIGNIYLYPTDTEDAGQDYEYHIFENKVIVKRYDGEVMFEGDYNAFKEFCDGDE